MTGQETTNENSILEAAHKIFLTKGFSGTSMQDIAQEAGTTKSMVNYYFRSKDKLFARVFREEFKNLFASIGICILSDLPLKQKIKQIVELDIERLMPMPDLPIFIMSELHRNPLIILSDLEHIPMKGLIQKLEADIHTEVKKGNIKPIQPMELMMNIQSLTIYPILAKPMLIHRLGMSEKAYKLMMEHRKTDIVEFIWNGIKI